MQSLRQGDVQGTLKNLRLPMKPSFGRRNDVPKLLIGLDHAHLGLPMKTRRFTEKGPHAAATKLGWVVFGPSSGHSDMPSPVSCH